MTTPEYVTGHALLEGKTVLVTAAAGTGIGSAVAQRCIEEGARVVVSDKHERRLGETAERLGVTGIPCDVTNEESVQALFAAASAELGAIDVLVNNAGLGGSAELHEMTDEQWNVVLDVTLNGTMRCTRAALNHMYANGHGVIVNNASVVGLARAGRAGALRGGEGGRDGAHPLRGDRSRSPRCACQRGGAEPRHARQPGQGHHRRAARRAHGARGVRSPRGAVGGGQRDRVPGVRVLGLHDR